ncbi:hypothetical protein BC829DRAFT_380221 [Chytridium lagenaria]|nr:hypothetical protein BC829DRAFT_380221 [Chytridium lagenaria]
MTLKGLIKYVTSVLVFPTICAIQLIAGISCMIVTNTRNYTYLAEEKEARWSLGTFGEQELLTTVFISLAKFGVIWGSKRSYTFMTATPPQNRDQEISANTTRQKLIWDTIGYLLIIRSPTSSIFYATLCTTHCYNIIYRIGYSMHNHYFSSTRKENEAIAHVVVNSNGIENGRCVTFKDTKMSVNSIDRETLYFNQKKSDEALPSATSLSTLVYTASDTAVQSPPAQETIEIYRCTVFVPLPASIRYGSMRVGSLCAEWSSFWVACSILLFFASLPEAPRWSVTYYDVPILVFITRLVSGSAIGAFVDMVTFYIEAKILRVNFEDFVKESLLARLSAASYIYLTGSACCRHWATAHVSNLFWRKESHAVTDYVHNIFIRNIHDHICSCMPSTMCGGTAIQSVFVLNCQPFSHSRYSENSQCKFEDTKDRQDLSALNKDQLICWRGYDTAMRIKGLAVDGQ